MKSDDLKIEFKKHVQSYVVEELLKGNKQIAIDKIETNIVNVKRLRDAADDNIKKEKIFFSNEFAALKQGLFNANAAQNAFLNAQHCTIEIDAYNYLLEVLESLKEAVVNNESSPQKNLVDALLQITGKE